MNHLVSRLGMSLLALVPATSVWSHPDDALPVPAGINYAPVAGEEFRNQVDTLLTCLQDPGCPLPMAGMVVVGPRLAAILEQGTLAISNLGTADISLSGEIDGVGSLLRMPGRFAQTPAENELLSQALRLHLLTGEPLVGRRLTTDELEVYWALIPFDITDPVFIVQTSSARTMFQLSTEGVIVWLDEITPVLTEYVSDSCTNEEDCYPILPPEACAVELDRIDACMVDECSAPGPRRGRELRAAQCDNLARLNTRFREAPCSEQLLQTLRLLTRLEQCEELVETYRRAMGGR